MYLLLASRLEQVAPLLPTLFPTKLEKVLYIPSAGNCEPYREDPRNRSGYQSCVALGVEPYIWEIDEPTSAEHIDQLDDASHLVVGGGNTYYLLYHLKRIGILPRLRTFLSRGGVYVGSSAGSCVCSPDIAYVGTQDDPEVVPDLLDTRGLGLVDLEIYPHGIEPREIESYSGELLQQILMTPSKKIFLRDHQALVVHDEWYRIVSTTPNEMSE